MTITLNEWHEKNYLWLCQTAHTAQDGHTVYEALGSQSPEVLDYIVRDAGRGAVTDQPVGITAVHDVLYLWIRPRGAQADEVRIRLDRDMSEWIRLRGRVQPEDLLEMWRGLATSPCDCVRDHIMGCLLF